MAPAHSLRRALLTTITWAVAIGFHSRSAAQPAKGEASPVWTVLDPVTVTSSGGSTLTKQADGSVLASGKHPSPDTYTITAHTKLTGIKAVRLEMLPDPSLGNRGPGRAPHGNFVLNEIRLTATPL